MLQDHLEYEDYPEVKVIEEGLEYIDFILVNNSAVDLVEHLHQHIGMEHDRV